MKFLFHGSMEKSRRRGRAIATRKPAATRLRCTASARVAWVTGEDRKRSEWSRAEQTTASKTLITVKASSLSNARSVIARDLFPLETGCEQMPTGNDGLVCRHNSFRKKRSTLEITIAGQPAKTGRSGTPPPGKNCLHTVRAIDGATNLPFFPANAVLFI